MGIDYLEELRRTERILEGKLPLNEKVAKEEPTSQESGIGTNECNLLCEELLKTAEELRSDDDSEAASAVNEVTGVSKEEMKRKALDLLSKKKKKEKPSESVVSEEKAKGESETPTLGEAPEKEAEGSADHYADLPAKDSPEPDPDVKKLLAAAPDTELKESDLKNRILKTIKKKAGGGK